MAAGVSGRHGPATPLRPRAHTQSEVDDASPGTLRTWYNNAEDELDAAGARVDALEKEVDVLNERVSNGASYLTATERNARRKQRRDAGEHLVSDDEDDGAIGLVNAVTTLVRGGVAEKASQAPQPPAIRKVAAADLEARDHFTNNAAIPTPVFDLWGHKLNIPLTMLTAPSLRRIARNENLKFTQWSESDTKKYRVLDAACFGVEADIDAATFMEGWLGWRKVLEEVADEKTQVAFKKYYDALTTRPEFRRHFKACVLFDMEVRSDWIQHPFIVDHTIFVKLPAFISEVAATQPPVYFAASAPPPPPSLPPPPVQQPPAYMQPAVYPPPPPPYAQPAPYAPLGRQPSWGSQSHSQRFAPYPTQPYSSQPGYGPPVAGPSRPNGSSFRGRCLLCNEEGHRAEQCCARTVRGGRPLFAASRGGSIVELGNEQSRICVAFNTGRGCPHLAIPGHAVHKCSLCGAQDHSAYAATCGRGAQ